MKKFTGSSEYVASRELMNAVNVAMALEKPLLIKGERERERPCWRRPSPRRWTWN